MDAMFMISPSYNNRGWYGISLKIEDANSGVEFLDLRMSYEALAKALTGEGWQRCTVELRGVRLVETPGDHPKEEA